MKSRKSTSSSGFLNGYPSISQGPISKLGEESVEEEDSEETEVASSLEGAPEASGAPNLSQSNQPLVSQDDGANDSIHGTAHSSSFPQG
ncbi:hypothetical protein O181_018438 [Austropuccinia psidii MF-1]|uniref:Uncharacterized protein n=1 Tax=Austropuccinia psidii MF-1 TaxID=1389203 RepID=A0A9Q3C936_9BASI|nr:hypothetical protein [Austropuccinia psidii MF-1]